MERKQLVRRDVCDKGISGVVDGVMSCTESKEMKRPIGSMSLFVPERVVLVIKSQF